MALGIISRDINPGKSNCLVLLENREPHSKASLTCSKYGYKYGQNSMDQQS